MSMKEYHLLTEYLIKNNEDIIKLSFNEIEELIKDKLPKFVNNHPHRFFYNSTRSSYFKYWNDAGYVAIVEPHERQVVFTKGTETFEKTSKYTKVKKTIKLSKPAPKSLEEEVLLTTPENLCGLDKDEYLMVRLSKENSNIVEACISVDVSYKPIGKEAFLKRQKNNDFSQEAYYEIINRIATENSTRTSVDTMTLLASFLADTQNNFLSRLAEGKPELVDDLLDNLVKNGSRRDKSLVSKVCRYLNEWIYGTDSYTINDSVVRAILPYYLAYYKIEKSLWWNKNLEDMKYVEFFNLFNQLKDKLEGLNRHQLDHLIWYAYKSDKIRFEMAKALSLVI